MTPERWEQIENLFHAALQVLPQDRNAFLKQHSANDPTLADEVNELLAAFDDSSKFMEHAPLGGAISTVVNETKQSLQTPRLVGERVGRYEVQSLLGTGGMGVVYLAHDSTLGRRIALKILPAQFTSEEAQVSRFEREAQAVSALNHPNIITIHEIGHDGEHHFIATEYVDGQTLRERLSDGPLPSLEAVSIATQIANALAAAHSAGIIHRDIKPENVMLRPDSLVKLLDFGLAKPLRSDAQVSHQIASRNLSLQTDPAILVGTLSYLSPEQIRGDNVDHRTDIFSLGVLFYEMLKGHRPFSGASGVEICKSILEEAPPPIDSVDPQLSRVVMRALSKDRSLRYQSASELSCDLANYEKNLQQRPSIRRRNRALAAASIVLLVALLGLVFWMRRTPRVQQSRTPVFSSAAQKLTDLPGQELFPSLSSDGRHVIFASRHNGNWELFRQTLGERSLTNITQTPNQAELQPTFSPDDKSIVFRSTRNGGGIFLMQSDGTNVRQLADSGFNPTWSPDGKEVAVADDNVWDYEQRNTYPSASQLWAINVETHQRRVITQHDAVQPSWSPHGDRLAFWGEQKGGRRDIWTVSAKGGDPTPVTDDEFIDWNPFWSSNGEYLYFLSNRGGEMNLWRVPIDESTGSLKGAFEPATLPANNCQQVSVARNGGVLVYGQNTRSENLWEIDFDAKEGLVNGTAQVLTQGLKRYASISFSPDEQSFVYLARGEPQQDLFIADRHGSPLQRLTDDAAQDIVPRWSPDGGWIAFLSDRAGKYEIWKIRPNGQGLSQMTYEPGREVIAPVWSPDGRKLLYQIRNVNSFVIDTTRPGREQVPESLAGQPPEGFIPWDWSPDGTQLIGWQPPLTSNQRRGVFVYSFVNKTYRRLTDFGMFPVWLSDSRQVLTREGSDFFLIDAVEATARKVYSIAEPNIVGSHLLSKDNRKIYYTSISSEADIWVLPLK